MERKFGRFFATSIIPLTLFCGKAFTQESQLSKNSWSDLEERTDSSFEVGRYVASDDRLGTKISFSFQRNFTSVPVLEYELSPYVKFTYSNVVESDSESRLRNQAFEPHFSELQAELGLALSLDDYLFKAFVSSRRKFFNDLFIPHHKEEIVGLSVESARFDDFSFHSVSESALVNDLEFKVSWGAGPHKTWYGQIAGRWDIAYLDILSLPTLIDVHGQITFDNDPADTDLFWSTGVGLRLKNGTRIVFDVQKYHGIDDLAFYMGMVLAFSSQHQGEEVPVYEVPLSLSASLGEIYRGDFLTVIGAELRVLDLYGFVPFGKARFNIGGEQLDEPQTEYYEIGGGIDKHFDLFGGHWLTLFLHHISDHNLGEDSYRESSNDRVGMRIRSEGFDTVTDLPGIVEYMAECSYYFNTSMKADVDVRAGIDVNVIRTGDVVVSLDGRGRYVHTSQGDIYSIHAGPRARIFFRQLCVEIFTHYHYQNTGFLRYDPKTQEFDLDEGSIEFGANFHF